MVLISTKKGLLRLKMCFEGQTITYMWFYSENYYRFCVFHYKFLTKFTTVEAEFGKANLNLFLKILQNPLCFSS